MDTAGGPPPHVEFGGPVVFNVLGFDHVAPLSKELVTLRMQAEQCARLAVLCKK